MKKFLNLHQLAFLKLKMKNKKFILKWTKKPDYRKTFTNKPNSKFLRQLERMLLDDTKKLDSTLRTKPSSKVTVPGTYSNFRVKTSRGKRPFRKSTLSQNRIFFRKFTRKFQKKTMPIFRQIFGFDQDNLDAFTFSRWFNRFFYAKRRYIAFRLFHLIRKLKKYRFLSRRRGKKKFFVLPKNFRLNYRKFAVKTVTKISPKFFANRRQLFKRFKRVKRIPPFYFLRKKRLKLLAQTHKFSSANYRFFKLKKPTKLSLTQLKFRSSFFKFMEPAGTPSLVNTYANSKAYSKNYFLSYSRQFASVSGHYEGFPGFYKREKQPGKLRFFFVNSHRRVPVKFFQINKAFTRKGKLSSTSLQALRRKKLASFRNRFLATFVRNRLINKFNFTLTQQSKALSSGYPSRKFFVRKNYLRFSPLLGVFNKYGRTSFKFKRRRLKFFKFFKKYFKLFRSYSGARKYKFKNFSKKRKLLKYYVHIFKSVNNLFVNVSTPLGRSIYVYSAGRTQYKGSKRLSPIAIETMGKNVSEILKNSEIPNVFVVFHCPVDFLSRALLRGLRTNVQFSGFRYFLNRPHNGLRKRASRRV